MEMKLQLQSKRSEPIKRTTKLSETRIIRNITAKLTLENGTEAWLLMKGACGKREAMLMECLWNLLGIKRLGHQRCIDIQKKILKALI
jgi:hypothetical protein